MSDAQLTEAAGGDDAAAPEPSHERVFSAYGVASAVLGVLSVAAIVLAAIIWSVHRRDLDERAYQSRVLQTAAEWTGVLINMNSDNIDTSLQKLHEDTIGELNVDFDAAMQPYRQVVQRLRSRSSGRIEAVAIESVHRDLGSSAAASPAPA